MLSEKKIAASNSQNSVGESVRHDMFQCLHVQDIWMDHGLAEIIQGACAIDDGLSILEEPLFWKNLLQHL